MWYHKQTTPSRSSPRPKLWLWRGSRVTATKQRSDWEVTSLTGSEAALGKVKWACVCTRPPGPRGLLLTFALLSTQVWVRADPGHQLAVGFSTSHSPWEPQNGGTPGLEGVHVGEGPLAHMACSLHK